MIPVLILFASVLAGWVVWESVGLYQRRVAHAALRRVLGRGKQPMKRVRVEISLRHVPDFLDLLSLGVSAGLTLEQAWAETLVSLQPGPFKSAVELFERDIRWGRSRTEAFTNLRHRLYDPQLCMTFALIEQSMGQGNRLGDVLSDQAEAVRQRRRNALERRVQTAGLRLLIPIFVFIFPAVFIVLLAPLFISFSTLLLF